MTTPGVVEIVVYIHGVSPSLQEEPHTAQYKRLHRGIKDQAKGWPGAFCGVEWGANIPAEKNPSSHRLLTKAQRVLGSYLIPVVKGATDWTLNPGRLVIDSLRELVFYGFGDMFYYVSSDG